MKDIPVLLMDSEQRCIEGIIYSLWCQNIEIVCLSNKKYFPARFSNKVSRFFISPDLSDSFELYFSFLINLPFRGVIVPSGDLSVMFLSNYKTKLIMAGFLLNIIDELKLISLFDKWECHKLCAEVEVPYAKTIKITNEASLHAALYRFVYPIIIKPTRLAGGNYIKVFNDKQAINAYKKLSNLINSKRFQKYRSGIIAQTWIESGMHDNWSCEIFYDKKGDFKGAVTSQRIRTSLSDLGTPTSRFYAGQKLTNDILVTYTRKLLEYVDWKGMAHVEFVYDNNSEKFLLNEVNPRLPGFTFFLSNVGFDIAYFYYSDLCDNKYNIDISSSNHYYFESLRYPGDITDGIVNISRNYINVNSYINSYFRAFFSNEKVIIEYFNCKDLFLTIAIQISNIYILTKKLSRYIYKWATQLFT